MSLSDGGAALREAINLRILPFNSAAAFRVKVMATVSVGSKPCQSFREVLSIAGQRIAPMPLSGTRAAGGRTRVAL